MRTGIAGTVMDGPAGKFMVAGTLTFLADAPARTEMWSVDDCAGEGAVETVVGSEDVVVGGFLAAVSGLVEIGCFFASGFEVQGCELLADVVDVGVHFVERDCGCEAWRGDGRVGWGWA